MGSSCEFTMVNLWSKEQVFIVVDGGIIYDLKYTKFKHYI